MLKNKTVRFVALAAMTLDGHIARRQGEFTNWTSPEDKDALHRHLDESDVIIVGNTTYEAARGPLSTRRCLVFTHRVKEVVVESDVLSYANPEFIDVIKYCLEHRYATVVILGGTETYTYFFDRDLIDDLYLTIEPISFGEGLPLHRATGGKRQARLVSVEQLNTNGSLMLHYTYAS